MTDLRMTSARHHLKTLRDAFASLDRQAAVVLLSIPILMTVLWYFGRPDFYHRHIKAFIPGDAPLYRLYPFFYFALSCFFLRTIVPLLIIRLGFGKRPAEFGYNPRGTFELWWVYLALFLLVVPFVVYASTLPSFQARYPFCDEAVLNNSMRVTDFLIYQAFYGLIFISGESFWRGFVVFGLERSMGYLGILVMVTPYCMSHYGKPVAETFGAILTGCVLGYLALRHRSFWLGVAVHWGVAILMDVLAIWQRGIAMV